jgi:hypothetical protein
MGALLHYWLIISTPPRSARHTVRIYQDDTLLSEQQSADPLAFIEGYQALFRVPD